MRAEVAAAAALATPAVYPAFFFVLGKAAKSAGNAVIPTYPMHRSHGLQRSLKRCYKHPFPTSINGYHAAKKGLGTIAYKMAHVCFHTRKRVHTRLRSKNRTQRLTHRNRGRFGWEWYHYPRSVPHVLETLRGQGAERRTLPLWDLGRVCSRRTQKAFGTAMRLCVSLSRGVAAPLGCVIFFCSCQNCGLYALHSGPFRVCVTRGGITTPGVLRVLPKRRTAACQKG